jgi:hypothetical protein
MNDQRQLTNCPHGELAVGWALRCLEPAEESLVAAHLPNCAACRDVVAQTEEVGAVLGLSLPELIPSAELEQRILSVTASPSTAPVVPLAPSAPSRNSVSARRPYRELAATAAVILVAVAVALGVRVVQLGGQLGEAQRQATAAAEAIRSAADPAAVRVPLVAKDGQAVGMVLASPGQVAVVATRLPSNQVVDQTYVLWGLAGNKPIALAAFDVSGEAPGLHVIPSATQTGTFIGYAISLEPGRRAPAVPTDIVATGKVSS